MKINQSIILTLICSVHAFGLYVNFGEELYFAMDALAICLIIKDFITKQNKVSWQKQQFLKPLVVLYILLFISTITCYIYHDQNIVQTLIAMRYFFYFLIYFQFHKNTIDKEWVEKLIYVGALIYIVIFYTQYIIFPIKIVNYGNVEGFNRGLLRFRIEGAGFLMLATFLSLNKYLVNKRFLYLLAYIIGIISLFMLGFRTLLVSSIISSILLVIKVSESPSKQIMNLVSFSFIISILYFMPLVQDYINEIQKETSSQYEVGEDYIRLKTFNFFINNVNVDEITLLLGNGFPQEESKYGKLVLYKGAKVNGFIFADLGLTGFSIIYGILSLLVFVYIAIKAFIIQTDRSSKYLNVYFIYLLLSSFTTVEIYRTGIFGIEALALFLIDHSKYKY